MKTLEEALAPARRRGASARNDARPTLSAMDSGEPEKDPEEIRLEARSRSERRIAYIQEVFEADPVDPSWAPAAEAQIVEAVDSDLLQGSSLRALECRMRLCRAEVEHVGDRDFELFSRELPTRLDGLPRTTMKRLPSAGGLERTIMYAAREGYRMPGPP
ncbi:MAG: hypothetical protein HYY06_04350 [Deltaproteobacteria bacterium]|nr:hypothetical protein [Deltaproteobacteria bacterium]